MTSVIPQQSIHAMDEPNRAMAGSQNGQGAPERWVGGWATYLSDLLFPSDNP